MFGIISTPVNSQQKYYKYVAEGLETKVLVIKASIQISLRVFVEYYGFYVTNNQIKDVLWIVLYRYDGLLLVFQR